MQRKTDIVSATLGLIGDSVSSREGDDESAEQTDDHETEDDHLDHGFRLGRNNEAGMPDPPNHVLLAFFLPFQVDEVQFTL